jgi:hypothetical protein
MVMVLIALTVLIAFIALIALTALIALMVHLVLCRSIPLDNNDTCYHRVKAVETNILSRLSSSLFY